MFLLNLATRRIEIAAGYSPTPFTGPPAGGIKMNRTPFNDFKRSNVVNRPAAR
jgi:hypothetical protein